MLKSRKIEAIVGIFIILGALGLVNLAVKVSGLHSFHSDKSFLVTAEFADVGGLKQGAPVKLGGVKVGQVIDIALDPSSLQAKVSMAIGDQYNSIPADSAADIYTQGILGNNYISLEPGFSSDSLKANSQIMTTHSAMVLEKLIGQFIYSKKSDGEHDKK